VLSPKFHVKYEAFCEQEELNVINVDVVIAAGEYVKQASVGFEQVAKTHTTIMLTKINVKERCFFLIVLKYGFKTSV